MRFLRSKAKFAWFCAGLGTGKTFSLAQYTIYRMLTNPETLGFIGAAQWTQVRDVTLAELFRALQRLNLEYDYSSLTNFITLRCNGARVKVFSMENYEMLRGLEIGWFALDEATLIKEEAYNVLLGRLRCRRSHRLEGRLVSTPRGFDYLYDRFKGHLANAHHDFIHATSFDNPLLPEGYIASLAGSYSKLKYRQEVMAEFVADTEGRVYTSFDRTEHVRPTPYMDGLTIDVGMDFNVNPMTAALAHVRNGTVGVFDEVYLPNANTFDMAKEIRRRYPHARVRVAPDASGQARKTSSSKTDHEILRQAGFEVKTSRRNPAIMDRYNTVNARFREGRATIDPKCEKLIRDLERVVHEGNPAYLTHISDALGYLVWRVYPLQRPRAPLQCHSL